MLDYSNYYICQIDNNFANIKMKDGSKLASFGCGVCCFSMVICAHYDIKDTNGKINVVKSVIENATNEHGLLTYKFNNILGYNLKSTKVTDIAAGVIQNIATIVQLNGHYILAIGYDKSKTGFEAYQILDPGNPHFFHLSQPMKRYGTVIKGKYILST